MENVLHQKKKKNRCETYSLFKQKSSIPSFTLPVPNTSKENDQSNLEITVPKCFYKFLIFFFFLEINSSTTWNMNRIENSFGIFKMIKYLWNLQNDQYTPKMKYKQNSFKILKMTKILSFRTS